MELILLIVLIVLLVGAVPAWPYSRGWGYSPVGIILFIVLIYLLLAYMGHIHIVHQP